MRQPSRIHTPGTVDRSEYDRLVGSKPKHQIAREHFDLACADVAEGDDRGAVSALFYAAEAAIVALADAHGVDTKRITAYEA